MSMVLENCLKFYSTIVSTYLDSKILLETYMYRTVLIFNTLSYDCYHSTILSFRLSLMMMLTAVGS